MLTINFFRIARILWFPIFYIKQLIYLNTPKREHKVKEIPQIKVGVFSTAFPSGNHIRHLNRTVKEAQDVVKAWRKLHH